GAVVRPLGADAVPWARYLAYRNALAGTFDGLAAERYRMPGGFSLTTPQGAAPVKGHLVSENYFDVLGVRPLRGRFFTSAAEPSVVIAERLWRQRFSADARLVGSTVRVDGRAYVVVGIAPAGFEGTTRGLPGDIWVPFEAYLDREDTSF